MQLCQYDIKIMYLTDARNNSLYNAYIYTGKNSDGMVLNAKDRKFPKPTHGVIGLANPSFGSNRNISADNWFSSIELVDILRRNKLSFVGTLKNKRGNPPSFLPSKTRVTILISSMNDSVCTDADTQKRWRQLT